MIRYDLDLKKYKKKQKNYKKKKTSKKKQTFYGQTDRQTDGQPKTIVGTSQKKETFYGQTDGRTDGQPKTIVRNLTKIYFLIFLCFLHKLT